MKHWAENISRLPLANKDTYPTYPASTGETRPHTCPNKEGYDLNNMRDALQMWKEIVGTTYVSRIIQIYVDAA